MGKIIYDNLVALLQAGSEEKVIRICQLAFNSLYSDVQSVATVAAYLNTDQEKAKLILHTLRFVLQANGLVTDTAAILHHFPGTFPGEIATMIAKVIAEHNLSKLAMQQVETSCMPQLVDFDWRVDMKASSDHTTTLSRVSDPTCLLQLHIRQQVKQSEQTCSNVEKVNIELTKQAMDSMLDGLGKIRNQLSNIAK